MEIIFARVFRWLRILQGRNSFSKFSQGSRRKPLQIWLERWLRLASSVTWTSQAGYATFRGTQHGSSEIIVPVSSLSKDHVGMELRAVRATMSLSPVQGPTPLIYRFSFCIYNDGTPFGQSAKQTH
jgi:hypothetical protein